MTLSAIIVSALGQLGRSYDEQTIDEWRDTFRDFANDAIRDIAKTIALRRTDTAEVIEEELDVSRLPKGCVKVMHVSQSGKPLPFLSGSAKGKMRVPTTGSVDVEYVYAPGTLENPSDVPDLPEYMHPLIVTYVVGRERATNDPNMQGGANVYFEMYNAGKAALLSRHNGELDAYRITNRW